MYLSISTTYRPATDLGYLLHKNPARVQSFGQSFGCAHVFYPDADEQRCTAVLLLDVDPVGLVRRDGSGGDFALEQYVNDRPYAASSFLSVALGDVFRSALGGRCKDKPELAEIELPLEAVIGVVPCRGGEALLRALFEPLGYTVGLERLPLDETFPDWGDSPYFTVRLSGVRRLRELLAHLYVLMPVLDNAKHYWVGEAEVDKLLRHGEGWLAAHPAREQIARRYLKNRPSLTRAALERLAEAEGELEEPAAAPGGRDEREARLEEKISLNRIRIDTVAALLAELGVESVVDLGCGEGRLLAAYLQNRALTRIAGMDVSVRALEIAKDRLNWERLPERQRQRLALLHGSLTYRDARLSGFDAATVIEVVEHLDPPRLQAFERVLFEFAAPRHIVMTTPNVEYNALFENLAAGQFRHGDHRFEWTRAEFRDWAQSRAERYGYRVGFRPVGEEDPQLGPPTQMAVFERLETLAGSAA